MLIAEADAPHDLAPHDLETLLARAVDDAERVSVRSPRALRQLVLLAGTSVVLFAGIAATTITLSPLLSSGVTLSRAVLPRLLGDP